VVPICPLESRPCLTLPSPAPRPGTPATTSQMAKDVTTFLSWCAEPELDDRHKMGLQAVGILSTLWFISLYVKRYKWAPIKARKIGPSPPSLLVL
jgi:ubiquinol-cytochrome c reductase cytochrome c1 subunit